MRLYLSSFGCGHQLPRLISSFTDDTTVAMIAHALDAAPLETVRAVHARELAALRALGLRPELVDLHSLSGRNALCRFNAVWVLGGNVFVLREALAATRVDDLVRDRVAADTLVYGGYSAGACVLGPSLDGFDLVDDPSEAVEPRWDGLGVLDRPLVPHIASHHPESRRCEVLSARLSAAGTPHWRLSDGDVLIRQGGHLTLLNDDAGLNS